MTTLNISLMLGMLAIAGLFAGGLFTMGPIVAAYADDEGSTEVDTDIENEAEAKGGDAENEDNDVNVQENHATVAQIADNDCSSGDVSLNDCDNTTTQTSTISQANVNDDRDTNTAVGGEATADAEQTICGQLAFLGLQLCDNEVEEED
jgi:hypothetical protein